MIQNMRVKGFEDGLKAGKAAKDQNIPFKKIIQSTFVDDRKIAKELMEQLKPYNVRWKTCFGLALQYSFGYDDGVLKALFD